MNKKGQSKLNRCIKSSLYGVIALMLIFMIALQLFTTDKSVRILGFQMYLISYTGSMEPELNYNDLIVVRKYDFYELKKGDVITFLASTAEGKKIPITHKINDIRDYEDGKREIQTKGVNVSLPDLIEVTIDGANGSNKYIGKYAFKSAFLGNMLAYMQSPQGIVAISVNTLCLGAIYILLNGMKKKLLAGEVVQQALGMRTVKQWIDAQKKRRIERADDRLNLELLKIEREMLDIEAEINALVQGGGAAEQYAENMSRVHKEVDDVHQRMRHAHLARDIHHEIVKLERELHTIDLSVRDKLKEAGISYHHAPHSLKEWIDAQKKKRAQKADDKLKLELLKLEREIEHAEMEINLLEQAQRFEEAQGYHTRVDIVHNSAHAMHQRLKEPHTYRTMHREIVELEKQIRDIDRAIHFDRM